LDVSAKKTPEGKATSEKKKKETDSEKIEICASGVLLLRVGS